MLKCISQLIRLGEILKYANLIYLFDTNLLIIQIGKHEPTKAITSDASIKYIIILLFSCFRQQYCTSLLLRGDPGVHCPDGLWSLT
jgi:hypothetical protein